MDPVCPSCPDFHAVDFWADFDDVKGRALQIWQCSECYLLFLAELCRACENLLDEQGAPCLPCTTEMSDREKILRGHS